MRLFVRVKIAQMGILARKAGEEVKKLALAVVIVEFMLAGAFAVVVNQNWTIEQIAPVEAKTTQHNDSQATPKPEAKPSIDENEAIADKIYQLESSSGKNDQKCERIGKHNGYGYAQGVDKNFCLDSDEEMRAVVIDWIERNKAAGLNESQMLDKYSGGVYK
jgi:hypothetical protein